MPNTNAPRGFVPVSTMGGRPLSGSFTKYRIASGSSTTIYQYDIVKSLSSGYIDKASAGDRPRGVFIGVQYVNASGIPVFTNVWTASTATLGTQDAVALICDDPNVIMEAQFTNSSTVPTQADIGNLYDLVDASYTGRALTGISGEGLDFSSTGTTSGKVFRAVSFVDRPDNDTTSSGGAYARVLCAFAAHDLSVATTSALAQGI